MKLINKCRWMSDMGKKEKMKREYKNAIGTIKLAAKNGWHETSFDIGFYGIYYDDIYDYIIRKLKKEGFKVEVEIYGKNDKKKLWINWE